MTLMLAGVLILPALLGPGDSRAALVPQPEKWAFWDVSEESATRTVDHSDWQTLLDGYLVAAHPSGITRFDYGRVSATDRTRLQSYVDALAAIDPRVLSRDEQMAYWINLYNALTVALVIDYYPVKSIRRIEGGLFGLGPWDEELVTVQGQALTLNDIEHRILRPVFNDPRVHYAVNCASLGCPNLAARAYSGATLDAMLDAAARAFVNHPRGVALTGKKLRLSKIYDWFAVDFGADEAGLLEHLQRYAEPELRARLATFEGRIGYGYDWQLNNP